VLVATVTAVVVGFLLFVGEAGFLGQMGTSDVRPEATGDYFKVIIGGTVLIVIVTILKVLGSKGKLLKGGMVSGHTAAGFFLAATILYLSRRASMNPMGPILAFIIALLVAQSRVEAKIHSLQEVVAGALLAMLLSAVVFWFAPT